MAPPAGALGGGVDVVGAAVGSLLDGLALASGAAEAAEGAGRGVSAELADGAGVVTGA
ncbi:MAG: hypothetical protein IPF92_28755 [Myxococcales bacterium]|jgi:hypothetical protein|nr:hypothetical protein [Myxococcales bacterium]MBL0196489.1 hypothetical protein [Myxococcales bacterium]